VREPAPAKPPAALETIAEPAVAAAPTVVLTPDPPPTIEIAPAPAAPAEATITPVSLVPLSAPEVPGEAPAGATIPAASSPLAISTPAPAEAPRPPAPPANPAPERSQSGWLSNLLAAASREAAEPRPPTRRPSRESLDSITTDIASLVEGPMAAEMWERWRQGDPNAISRRLYTAAGQQAFEDVRRRIRNDPPFRESVIRYVNEFERLLAKIGQSDKDGAQSRAAMLSDSGKVYMLLAHAAGRLG
jgi:hypothetical protein